MELKRAAAGASAVLIAAVAVPLLVWQLGQTAKSMGSGGNDGWLSKAAVGSYSLTLGGSPVTQAEDSPSSRKNTGIAGRAAPLTAGGLSALDIFCAPQETETHTGREIPTPLPSDEVLGALPYINDESAQDGLITRYTFTDGDGGQFVTLDNGSQVRNCTEYDNDYLLGLSRDKPDLSYDITSEEPLVLIYHTHATESFERTEREHYDSAFSCKTTERDMNIVSVGDEICKSLEDAGISCLHDTLVHDYPSYDAAYDSSRETVKALLDEYPSIKIVLDIHRDGIERDTGERLAPYCEIDGSGAAQIMIIACAVDENGAVPGHLDNFRFACALQEQCELDYPQLCRPLLFDYRFYNQDLSPCALLIEVGSQANSIDEVRHTGRLLGKELGKLMIGQ